MKKTKETEEYFSVFIDGKPESKGKLKGLTFSFKDNICVKGIETKASSKILEGYKPLFDATAVERIRGEGGQIIGKTIQDEFGFGSFCTNTGIGIKPPKNPVDKERVTGGSSGGSAAAVKVLDNHVSIAESTGGSIANPAAFCGVIGLTPTYGLVSRHGLLDYANSLDKIGVISRNIKDAARTLSVIAGSDGKDMTCTAEKKDYEGYLGESVKGMTIGIPKEYVRGLDPEVEKGFLVTRKILEKKGVRFKDVSLRKNAEYSIPTYYVIAMCEASTNLAKYSGLRYGYTEEIENEHYDNFYSRVRGSAFGEEAKRRILLGTFARMTGYRDAYYDKALKARTILINEYKEAFKDCDAIMHPTMPILPPTFEDAKKLTPLQNYMLDLLTVGANLAGLPHISVPAKNTKLPVGVMFTADHFDEEKLIILGESLE